MQKADSTATATRTIASRNVRFATAHVLNVNVWLGARIRRNSTPLATCCAAARRGVRAHSFDCGRVQP